MEFGMVESIPFGLVYGATGALAVIFGPRAYTFLRAIISGWNKDNIAGRLAICDVCPRVKKRSHIDDKGKELSYLYCDECKCGSHHLAELHVKMGFNDIRCPMGKFGPAGAQTVHEAHEKLSATQRAEQARDNRERTNMMAGRDRDDDGPPNRTPAGPSQLSARAAAQAQLQPTTKAANEQRQRIELARQQALRNAQREAAQATNTSAHVEQTNRIWGDREPKAESATATVPSETNNAAPLAGTDHEGHILVDKETSDGGNRHSLDERRGG